MSADETLSKAEELLDRLEAARAELDQHAANEDTEGAIAVLQQLADLAREIEAELQRARREADARP
jgi:hypothetical protein